MNDLWCCCTRCDDCRTSVCTEDDPAAECPECFGVTCEGCGHECDLSEREGL